MNTNELIRRLQALVKEDPTIGFLPARAISYDLPADEDSSTVEHVQVEGVGRNAVTMIR